MREIGDKAKDLPEWSTEKCTIELESLVGKIAG